MTREVGPSMLHMSAKEEVTKQSSHTSNKENDGAVGGMRNSITKPTNADNGEGKEDEEKPVVTSAA